jgi:hypothetical protein
LRAFFALITLAAIAIYWCIVRPTTIANRFVMAVGKQDYETAQSFYISSQQPRLVQSLQKTDPFAEVLPWDWGDIWRWRRRILLTCHFQQSKDGRQIDWTAALDLCAKPNGIEELPSNCERNLP